MARPRLRRFFRHGLFPQLIAFEACVRHASVTRAADELALAQPTVSGLVRKLSEAIGEPLLRPNAGRMEPTEAGRELLLLLDELFAAFERYESRRPVGGLPGTMRHRPTTDGAFSDSPGATNF